MANASLSHIRPNHRFVVERLWQLYRHDLSEFRGSMPDHEGRYRAGHLPAHLHNPGSVGYLIHTTAHHPHVDAPPDPALAGFVFVTGLAAEARMIAEFFVVRAVRRHGVGHAAAVDVLNRHPGAWEIVFQEENPAAARFWRRVAADCATGPVREERRPVPDKPQIPPETWLFLTTG
jgi:predicted acetyltransferase